MFPLIFVTGAGVQLAGDQLPVLGSPVDVGRRVRLVVVIENICVLDFDLFKVESQLVAGVEIVVAPVVHKVSALSVDGHGRDVVDGGLHWHVGELVLPPLVLRAGADAEGDELAHEHLEVLMIISFEVGIVIFISCPVRIKSFPELVPCIRG